MERMKPAKRQLEAEKANPPPSTGCFCCICGGTSTWRQHLVHDACLEILKKVYRVTVEPTRPPHPRKVLHVLDASAKDRDSEDFD